jgi:hypothetical protein
VSSQSITHRVSNAPRPDLVRLARWLGVRKLPRARRELEAVVHQRMNAWEHPRLVILSQK